MTKHAPKLPSQKGNPSCKPSWNWDRVLNGFYDDELPAANYPDLEAAQQALTWGAVGLAVGTLSRIAVQETQRDLAPSKVDLFDLTAKALEYGALGQISFGLLCAYNGWLRLGRCAVREFGVLGIMNFVGNLDPLTKIRNRHHDKD